MRNQGQGVLWASELAPKRLAVAFAAYRTYNSTRICAERMCQRSVYPRPDRLWFASTGHASSQHGEGFSAPAGSPDELLSLALLNTAPGLTVHGGSLRPMVADLVYALVAAVIVGVFTWALAKPRSLAGRWLRHAWWWLFLRTGQERDEAISKHIDEIEHALTERLNTVERSMARIARELAQRQYDQEGNPDDEFYSDWYRWFTGDPDADVDYSRKQERDLARLRNGDFRRRT